jgi:hemerythrin-like domain-containing protein
VKAIGQLKEEHRVIETVVPLLGSLRTTFEGAEQVLEFLEVFVDQCHHGKEERYLFPTLEARGVPRTEGLVLELLKEHGAARRYVREIHGLLHPARADERSDFARLLDDRLAALAELLREHISKEDTQLWPLARRTLQPKDDALLLAGFAEIEEKEVGEERHRKYLNWARLWGGT